MRIRRNPNPKTGDQRLRKKFLWLPLTLENETRWLEKARVVQTYVEDVEIDMAGCPVPASYWQDTQFWYGQ
jgi:hypothetical protein